MDAGALYLRVVLGAKPFSSSELDSLAQQMGAAERQSSNPKERYFATKMKVAAFTFGNKLLFGSNYFESLSNTQRLAVAAHEFGHVLGDNGERKRRLIVPSTAIGVLLAVLFSVAIGSMIALTLASVLGFLAAVAILSSLDSGRYLRHEMSCDKLAATHVDGQALVEAIHIAESMQKTNAKGMASFWRKAGGNPATKARIDAILASSDR